MQRLKCKCWNPLQPRRVTGQYADGWMKASGMNIALANNVSRPMDVVFLGDSITEGWNGRWMGNHYKSFANNSRAFRRLFSREEGGQLDGLALGIANDGLVNLLYRIMHGEVPETLQAKVFWVLIGTNDLGLATKCSPEATVAGIIRIIQELKKLRPDSIVVVNSILPTSPTGKLRGKVMWEERIQNVNRRMECYSHTTEGVEFFNATDIFTDKDEKINTTLMMKDRLHPSWFGYDVWSEQIAKRVKELT
jgi:lysophospholipase L1-like esterase